MASKKSSFDWRIFFLLPLPLLWWLAGQAGYLDFLENKLLDWRFAYRGEIEAPVRVIYVDVDSRAIADIGNFPWDRSFFAEVAEALIVHGGVKGIGLDFVFSESGLPNLGRQQALEGNVRLGRVVHGRPEVILAASYSAGFFRDALNRERVRQIPLLAEGLPPEDAIELPEMPEFRIGPTSVYRPQNVGLIDTYRDNVRWVPLFAPTPETTYWHMAVRLALLHWGVGQEAIRLFDDRMEIRGGNDQLLARIPLTRRQLVEVNWFSPWISEGNPRCSFSVAYGYAMMMKEGTPAEQEEARRFFEDFRDGIVLIGPVDRLLQDLAVAPLSGDVPVPKVGLHGNLLKTIVAGIHLKRSADGLNALLLFGLTLAVSSLATVGGPRGVLCKVAAVVLLIGLAWAAFELFARLHWVLPLAGPLGAAFSTSFVALVWQLAREEKQKGRIRAMFGSYVSPELVSRMVESGEDPKLGGVEENITAYFSDIQSFSTFSESLTPALLVELMNEYLTACTDVVTEEGGTLDKYIGDAVVAIYGAPVAFPDHALRACVAAHRVHQRQAELREKWRQAGGKWPPIVMKMQTRIGLNSGPAIIGNMGSQTRFNYTMMGDNVNLAARMESGAKAYGVYTMISEATRRQAEDAGDRCVFRPLDKIVVMGRSQAVQIHELVGFRSDLSQAAWDCIDLFTRGLERYWKQEWDSALALFAQSAELEPYQPGISPGVKTNPSLVYVERCREMKASPPGAGWDGIYVMKSK